MSLSLGLIHTHASIKELRTAADALRGDWIKIVPAWWPHGPAAAAALPYKKVYRSSWGDPSYANGARAYPLPDETIAEVRPYVALIPDAVIEVGNEPSGHGLDPHLYNARLVETVRALRQAFPRARILPPAHSPHAADRAQWLQILASISRECHALTIHGYSDAEVHGELRLIRQHVSASQRVWLTEVNYGRDMSDADRAAGLLALFGDLPGVEVALLYHLDTYTGDPLQQQGGAFYRLNLTTLQLLGAPPMQKDDPPIWDIDLAVELAALPKRPGAQTLARRTVPDAGIIVHYGGLDTKSRTRAAELATLRSYARHHLQKNWQSDPKKAPIYANTIMYRWSVLSDGAIVRLVAHPLKFWQANNITVNDTFEAVVLPLGPNQPPTEAQVRSLHRLLDRLRGDRLSRTAVFGHCEVPLKSGAPVAGGTYITARQPGQSECPSRYIHAEIVRYRAEADRWRLWGSKVPLAEHQKTWSIPRLWHENAPWLGAALSEETYLDPNTSVQTFVGGAILFEKLTGATHLIRRTRDAG